MGHYFKKLKTNKDHHPNGWTKWSDKRSLRFFGQRLKYGFDERETWNLNYAFYVWLYERLKMYNDINIINTSYHRFKFDGVEINMQEGIDMILNICEKVIQENDIEADEDMIVPRLFVGMFGLLWW